MAASFIKLDPGQQQEATLKSNKPNEYMGKYGLQLMYTFLINGQEATLGLSESSPANNDIKAMEDGSKVVIKKVNTSSGNTAWVVTAADDITNSIPVPTPEEFMDTTPAPVYTPDNAYEDKDRERQKQITWGQCCNGASRIVAAIIGKMGSVTAKDEAAKMVLAQAKALAKECHPEIFPNDF